MTLAAQRLASPPTPTFLTHFRQIVGSPERGQSNRNAKWLFRLRDGEFCTNTREPARPKVIPRKDAIEAGCSLRYRGEH